VHRRATDDELREEVRQFVEAAEAELISEGVSPAEARRMARLKYGSAQSAQETVRAYGWENALVSVLTDLRYGLRLLLRNPGFTLVSVLTLGLGIGAATAIFSAVYPVLFQPLSYPDAGRILAISDRSTDGAEVPITYGSYRELVERNRSFQAMAAYKPWQPTATGGEPERLEGQRVGADFFRVLGVVPSLGRGFDAVDDRPGGANVVILSHGLWQRRFGGDSTIIGRDVQLDGVGYRVGGVMPREFENVPPHAAQVWSLLQYDPALPSFEGREWGHHLSMLGRVRAEVDPAGAELDLQRVAANPIPEWIRPRWASLEDGLFVRPLKESAIARARPTLLALSGAVALLLIIAGVNVANLQLARGARRRGEMAMRAALGAAKGRLVRQLLTEGLLLAAVGGALGLAFAWYGVGALVALSPAGLPRAENIALDASAFAFALMITGLIGVIVGLIPALGVSRRNLAGGLQEASQRTGGGHLATRRVLVVAEVALAVVLLAGAGLLLRTMSRLSDVPLGFDASDRVVMRVQTSGPRFGDDDTVLRFFEQALAAVRALPGVRSAALTSQLPLSGDLDIYGVQPEHDPRDEGGRAALRYTVSPGYFATTGIPLIRGGLLPETDAGTAPSAVLSESLARALFPGREAIGERVHVGRGDLPWYTVVGVVGNVVQASLDADAADAVYVTPRQWYFADPAPWIVVRADGNAASLIPSIKDAVWSVDGDQPIVRVATMEDVVTRSESQRRFAMITLEAFALLALVLAVVGLYGVMAGSVTERWQELGVRSALGASRRSIRRLVLRQGLRLTGLGVVIGLTGAALASEAVVTLLFGVSRLDPVTYLAVVVVLVVASALACWIPASRAAGIEPAKTLRVG
jgi:putative ABC transport system permease protein